MRNAKTFTQHALHIAEHAIGISSVGHAHMQSGQMLTARELPDMHVMHVDNAALFANRVDQDFRFQIIRCAFEQDMRGAP